MPRRSISLSSLPLISLLLLGLLLGGCATTPGRTTTEDRWEGFNRGVYKFNDVVDRATLKPIAKGYRTITPQWFRTGTRNFFNNLDTPWTIVNQLLQGKPKLMAQDTCRFLVNTIVGLGGVIDVASKVELTAHDEDFGQTLAVWGVPSGPYLMLPFLGPATIRDGTGRVPDYFGSPQRYADIPWETKTGLSVLDLVQMRESLLSTEESIGQAYDRYGLIRDAWLQRRQYMIFDGNPPDDPVVGDEAEMDADDAAALEAAEPSETTKPAAPAESTKPAAPGPEAPTTKF
jgi:phospholipid-binding lipoprotein MlaA